MEIKINDVRSAVVTADQKVTTSRIEEYLFPLPAGKVKFSLNQFGDISSYGIRIGNMRVHKLISKPSEELEGALGAVLQNNITSSMNMLPGGRVFLMPFLNFLSVFDRVQFHYYHKANYS